MQVITRPIPLTKLKSIAKKRFGNLVKAVVDVKRGVAAIDADLHAGHPDHMGRGSTVAHFDTVVDLSV